MGYTLLFIGCFLLLFLVIDLLQKRIFTRRHWARKATHILSGGIIILLPDYLTVNQILILAGIFFVVLGISRWKNFLALHRVDRETIGEILYPISIGIIAWLCLPGNPQAFRLSALILAISDGLAGALGEAWDFRTVQMGRYKKSLGGALVFFTFSWLLVLIFNDFSVSQVLPALVFAAVLTGVEFVLVYGFDNLALPVLAALIQLYFFA